jgi:outer membrane protein assembly factor BamA
MPVFLVVDAKTERTESIFAPSASWNRVIGHTATFRWFNYPDDQRSMTITGSVSSRVNWGTLFMWSNLPLDQGSQTDDVFFRLQRSVFFRFFGIGPDTVAGNETSHTRLRVDLAYRRGINIVRNFNIGARVELARDLVQNQTAPGFPFSRDVFPNTPGMSSASIFSQSLDIRYDTRPFQNYSLEGWYGDLAFGPVEGLAGSPTYFASQAEGRVVHEELPGLSGGARFLVSYVTSTQTPFYYQSNLGGSDTLRGFTEDRFIDRGSWTLELEQRIRLFATHIYGVTTDWRVDPFITIGQVYHDFSGFFSHVRVTEGLGFRAWVRPNVLGRIDVATGGEGLKVYVELGYPF